MCTKGLIKTPRLITIFYSLSIVTLILILLKEKVLYFKAIPILPSKSLSYSDTNGTNQNEESRQKDIIEIIRRLIRKEIRYVNLIGNHSKQLSESTFRKPITTVIVSTWRSGSTFLGQILNEIPGTFYHYEPLMDYRVRRFRNASDNEPMKRIVNLLRCNFEGAENLLDFARENLHVFEQNTRLWRAIRPYKKRIILNSQFLSEICKLYPFQLMKLVRLSLNLAKYLLEIDLNIKLIYLVRDPRAIYESRRHRKFCPGSPECASIEILCEDLSDDYKSYEILKRLHPHRFLMIRFEQFALNLTAEVTHLLEYLNLGRHKRVDIFLRRHSHNHHGGPSSTFRITKNVPFKWLKVLPRYFVEFIEKKCKDALRLWRYRLVSNETYQDKDINTMLDFGERVEDTSNKYYLPQT